MIRFFIEEESIEGYIALGADATALDKEGHNALWHLYHPVDPSTSIDSSSIKKRIIASEIYMEGDNNNNSYSDTSR